MPLPFILAGAAIAVAGFGAKKGYDGYQDKTEANKILNTEKIKYESQKCSFDAINERTTKSLTKLGELQLQIGKDFKSFRSIAESLLKKLNESGSRDINIDFPQHRLNKIDGLALSTTTYLGKVAGAGVVLVTEDAELAQLVAHGRVDARIATCDFKTCFFGDGGNATHERTGYAYDVDVLHEEST